MFKRYVIVRAVSGYANMTTGLTMYGKGAQTVIGIKRLIKKMVNDIGCEAFTVIDCLTGKELIGI